MTADNINFHQIDLGFYFSREKQILSMTRFISSRLKNELTPKQYSFVRNMSRLLSYIPVVSTIMLIVESIFVAKNEEALKISNALFDQMTLGERACTLLWGFAR